MDSVQDSASPQSSTLQVHGWALDLDHGEGPASEPLLTFLGLDPRQHLSWEQFLAATPAEMAAQLQDLHSRLDGGQCVVAEGLALQRPGAQMRYNLQATPIRLPASRSALFSLHELEAGQFPGIDSELFREQPDMAMVILDAQRHVAHAAGTELGNLGILQWMPDEWFAQQPADVQRTLSAAVLACEDGSARTVEMPLGTLYYRATLRALKRPGHTALIFQNISEPKRLSLLLEQTQVAGEVGGWELDCRTQVLYWTEETYRIHAVDSRQFQPNIVTVTQFFDDRGRAELEDAIFRCSTQGDSFDFPLHCIGSALAGRLLRVQGRPVWKDGQVVRLFGSYQDVTQRHQDQELLRRGQERTRALLKAIPDLFFVLDAEGTFIEFSAPDPSMLLAPPDQINGHNIRQVVPELADSYFEASRQAISSGRVRTIEYGSRERRFEARLVACELDKSPSVVVLVRDITDRYRQEVELRKSREDALQASKVKSQFLANMSHEIRTPLNGVIGMTDLALHTDLTNEQREYLDASLLSARSLLGIIDDILDLSKIEAGRLELESIPFSVRAVVREVLSSLALRAHEKGLELLGNVRAEVPQLVVGDPVRFRQLVTNLLSNAIKFTEKGEVEIEVAVREGETLRVSVYDTGPGIASERQTSIFEPFTQADGSTTRRFGGTGLGLTICRQLVEKMGGRIWLESQLGQGSRFSFTARLPSYHVETEQGPQAALGRELGNNVRLLTPEILRAMQTARVLIVDDNASSRRILRDQVASWGIEPVTVAGPGPALHAVREATRLRRPFRLAIIDFQMPACNGLELARELPDHIPRFLLTTVGRPSPEQLMESKVAGVLCKPVAGSELAEAVLGVFTTPTRELLSPAPALPPPGDTGGGLNILLAEDNLINAKVIGRLLEGMGYKVKHVANGALAVEDLLQARYDLVLMDIQMPVMDGYEATRRIRHSEAATGYHATIVALTANAMTGDRERCIEAGMDNYLTKPIDRGKLVEVLQEVRAKVAAENSNSNEVVAPEGAPSA